MDREDKKLNINLMLDSCFYRGKIDPEEEELFRAAGAILNNLIKEVSTKFGLNPDTSKLQILRLVAYQSIINELRALSKTDVLPYIDKLTELETDIDKLLQLED